MHNFKWIISVFSMELRKFFSYRSDFWTEFLGTFIIQMLLSYFLWDAVFQDKTKTMQGMTFQGVLTYFLYATLMLKVVQANSLSGYLSTEIYSGELNRYLLMPLSIFPYKLAIHMAQVLFNFLQFFFFLAVFKYCLKYFLPFPPEFPLEMTSFILTLISLLLASLFYFQMVILLELVAFWTEQVWTLLVMLRLTTMFLGGVLIPLDFFPQKLQHFLSYLPFSYLISFPIKIIQGKINLEQWIWGTSILLIWSLFLAKLTHIVWKRGNQQYTGVGI